MPPDEVSLREYVDARFAALEVRLLERGTAISERLQAMTEIQESIREQASLTATRAELSIVRDHLNEMKTSARMETGIIAFVISLAAAVVSKWLFR